MRKYYTRPCNFHYGSYAKRLITKKKGFPLAGNPNIAFDKFEIFFDMGKIECIKNLDFGPFLTFWRFLIILGHILTIFEKSVHTILIKNLYVSAQLGARFFTFAIIEFLVFENALGIVNDASSFVNTGVSLPYSSL